MLMSFADKFVDKFVGLRSKIASSTEKKVSLFNAADNQISSGEKLGVMTEWFFAAPFGMARKLDIDEVREFARSNWADTIITAIIDEVSQTRWDVVAKDDGDLTDYSVLINQAKDFLNNPNRNKDTFLDLIKPVLRDILEIDAGVWVKVFDGEELVELWPRDGATFLKEMDHRGVLLKYYQYSWRNPVADPIEFENREVVYFMNNPKAYKIYGFSPLMACQPIVDYLVNATRYNKDFFQNNAIPSMVAMASGASDPQLNKSDEKHLQSDLIFRV